MSHDFVDYYELLEISPNASLDTIERVFRYLAKRHHPDVSENGDVQKFSSLVEAFETLRDPELRAAYDVAYAQEQNDRIEIIEQSDETENDTLVRLKILTLFYTQRRRDMRKPGLGIASVEQMVDCPYELLEFHLWYFREKGWIQREESGQLAITAAGVDQIEAKNERILSGKFIEAQPATQVPIVRDHENGVSVSEVAFD